ncbi:flagellar hook-basal body protein [Ponticaulis koreensis]|uniref:flagellar hook-basal body protein n=1 Tax=Ponticaulis koreensis TaxID=1123045 RepID=UPI0003B6EDE2|nr:flagellar hook-basal body protein [Ponticaulis koreensis]
MDNTLLVGINTQQSLRRRMDVVANNLANMNTAGFKAEVALNDLIIERPSHANDTPEDIRFTSVGRMQRDMTTGTLRPTGNSLDFGIEEANAFFSVRVGGETYYTRDGQFALDELSRLVTHEGALVLDDAGNEMVFDPEGGPPTVSDTGIIRQGNIEIGRLGVYGFETPGALEKIGSNLWSPGDQQAEAVELPKVQQGVVEQSNVNAILEVTRMIEISRAYTSASRLVKDADELRKTAINKLGSAQ